MTTETTIITLYSFTHGLMTTYISLYQDSNFSEESTVVQLQTDILLIIQNCYMFVHTVHHTRHIQVTLDNQIRFIKHWCCMSNDLVKECI